MTADDFLPEGVDRKDVTYIGLVLNERGLDRALAAGVDEINVVVAASETFSRRNQNIGVPAMLDAAEAIAARAAEAKSDADLVISTAFGICPFEGEVPAGRRPRDRRPRGARRGTARSPSRTPSAWACRAR